MTDLTGTISHIWQVIVYSNTFNFVVFVAILVWIFKKINISAIVDNLRQKIIELIEAARKAKEDAQIQLKEAEKSVENLPQELKTILEDADKSAKTIEQKLLDEAKQQVESIESNAQKTIKAEEKVIKSNLISKTSKASVELAKSHVKSVLVKNPELHEKYINASIDELDRLNF